MAPNIALAGATGNLGSAILQQLLNADFQVTVLSRKGSKAIDSLPTHSNLRVARVDYDNLEDLSNVLRGIDIVVSAVTTLQVGAQTTLIDACVAAGVTRFLPSDFGCDLQIPSNRELPVYDAKLKIQAYLMKMFTEHPDFSYTIVYNNAFLDWGLENNFIMDVAKHEAVLYDGGLVPFSLTTLATVGKAIVGVVRNLHATKNRAVRVYDVTVTLQGLIEKFQAVDGKQWKTSVESSDDCVAAGYAEMQKAEPDMTMAMTKFIMKAAMGQDTSPDFSDRSDNQLLGIECMNEEGLQEVIKQVLEKKSDPGR